MIKIDFEVTTERGLYRDALWLKDDHGLSDAEIADMKQARVNNWLAGFMLSPEALALPMEPTESSTGPDILMTTPPISPESVVFSADSTDGTYPDYVEVAGVRYLKEAGNG